MKSSKIKSNIELAEVAFNEGFKSKSAKNEAMKNLNRAYEIIKDSIQDLVLEVPKEERTEEHNSIYWDLPNNLHVWKAKHSALVISTFPEMASQCELIEQLVELRHAIKNAEIQPVEVNEQKEKVIAVQKSLQEMLEQVGKQYQRGMNLSEMFGGLDVHANVHMVTNQYGTRFVRAFYYLFGELTALNVIIAVAQDNKKRKEESKNV